MNKYLLIFFLSLTMLCSCSDDKAPADADENFITSVTLTVGNDSYDAVINDDTIKIIVPYTVSLDGATASVVYTTSAKIYPNPQEITDWNSERVFRVVSYNGDERQYIYTVVKDEIRENGDIVLKNAADIAALAEKGVSVINGNLTIGTESGEEITDITALSNLKEVTGTITILDSYKGAALTGLDNVKSVGSINIGSSEVYSTIPLQLFSLSSLEKVTGDINIYNNTLELIDFKSLPTIGGSVNIASAKLKSITADKLENISGDFIVNCKNGKASGGEIKELSLPEITNIGGKLSGENFENLETISFPKLQTAGSIVFEELPFDVSKIDFPEIVEINGDLSLISQTSFQAIGSVTSGNTNLQAFDGFGKLQKVAGIVTVKNFTGTTNIPDVRNASIGGIVLERMSNVSVLYLNNTQFKETEGVSECQVYLNRMALEKIVGSKSMDCYFVFDYCNFYKYEGLPEFENIESIGGLYIGVPSAFNYDNPVISAGLKKINGYMQIYFGSLSVDYITINMPNLTEVQDYVYISGDPNGMMYNILFPSLATIGGELYVGAYGINNFDLSSLKEVSINKTSEKLAVDVPDNLEKDFEMGYGINLSFRRGTGVSIDALEKVGGKGMKITIPYRKTTSFSCPKLYSISSGLEITGASSSTLSDIKLSALTSCPKVKISTFKNLNDFSTFSTLFKNGQIIKDGDWTVTGCKYNPTYQDMKEGRYTPAE